MFVTTIMADIAATQRTITYRPSRPPTAVYPDQHQVASFRNKQFPPTESGRQQIFMINLEGAFLSPGALIEMIVPLAQSIRSGIHGPTVLLVVTSDNATIEFLESLAQRHDFPLFVSSSPNEPLRQARPIGSLTPTEEETLALVRSSGGEVTSSRIANLAGIEPNAAVNRVAGLVRKGYVHRVSRPRSEGDTFVDLLSAAEVSWQSPLCGEQPLPSAHGDFKIPEDIRESVVKLAAMQGSKPADVLVRAWSEFLTRHREVLDTDSKEVGRMIREGDTAGLATYTGRHARERAKQAVSRNKP